MQKPPAQRAPLPAAGPSYYKRTLPDTCTAFDSPAGRRLFREALQEANMEAYFALSMQFLTQSEPAFCGLASLCMALNALEIDPVRQWKGVWRWWDESMLDCCRPLAEVRERGVTLPELACLARCNGLATTLRLAESVDRATFERDLALATEQRGTIMLVSYSRASLQQTGAGHFSPVGGLHRAAREALVLDVARFKYPAYWVAVDRLWEAMLPHDDETHRSRGYLLLSRDPHRAAAPCFTPLALSSLALNGSQWPVLYRNLYVALPASFGAAPPASLDETLDRVIGAVPDEYIECVKDRRILFTAPPLFSHSSEPAAPTAGLDAYLVQLDDLLRSVAALPLYQLVAASAAGHRKRLLRQASSRLVSAAIAQVAAAPAVLDGSAALVETVPALSTIIEDARAASYTGGPGGAAARPLVPAVPARILRELSSSVMAATPAFCLAGACAAEASVASAPDAPVGGPANPTAMLCCLTNPLYDADSENGLLLSSTGAPGASSGAMGATPLSAVAPTLVCRRRASSVDATAHSTTSTTSTDSVPFPPNDFLCFLTLFLLALFSFRSPTLGLAPGLAERTRALASLDHLSESIRREVALLCNQLSALDSAC